MTSARTLEHIKKLAKEYDTAVFASYIVFPDGNILEYTRTPSPGAIENTKLFDFYTDDLKASFTKEFKKLGHS